MDPRQKAQRLAREAEGYLELTLYPEALERAEALLRDGLFPETAVPIAAESLRGLERYAEAIPYFERLITQEPAGTAGYVGLGWCLKRTGRLDLALEVMERLVAAHPEDPIGHYNLACYASLAGRPGRAIECLARAIDLSAHYRDLAREESDFDPVRENPDFRRLVEET
jgi:tetratricopeptide (TPR) repeat protein